MNVPRVNVSNRRFQWPNPERRAREERRFQAELVACSTSALAVQPVVAAPEAQTREKCHGKIQKRLSKKRRKKKRCQAASPGHPRVTLSFVPRPHPRQAAPVISNFRL